ncbi:hypothetical protein MKAN_07535 [Mycobacterium kansasii ATCC 12478]|uniref:Uncharacterized protein n=1 Tax=Mycobacterium kansasii ATCC 12478 TaxID=557599 RepID=U5WYT0_MYCKA|nr:hypothetical protein MKAN_07535 [Mycobacterium kansasii ATCC 12478]
MVGRLAIFSTENVIFLASCKACAPTMALLCGSAFGEASSSALAKISLWLAIRARG